MSALDQLYQQVILDHYREKHGHGLREAGAGQASADSEQYNPLCGDQVHLRVTVAERGDGPVVTDVSWDGEGCSISQASTSMLHDLMTGAPVVQARAVVAQFRTMVRSRGEVDGDEDVLGDAVAFHGVGRQIGRVKCAMLGWTAFEDALYRAVPELFEVPAASGDPATADDASTSAVNASPASAAPAASTSAGPPATTKESR